MPTLPAPSVATLRLSHPHSEHFYMSVLQPDTLYIGQVTGTPVRGATVITLADISGVIASVQVGQTAIIYDASSGAIVSKRRLRSRSGQIFTFDENNINWSTAYYIKILHTWELWSVFPYIDPTTKIFYKDRDIVYTDENTLINPVAILDSYRAKFLDGVSVSFSISGARSYAMTPGATITGYAWSCDGGVIANAAIAATTITFTVAGQYWLALTVTDSSAQTKTIRVPLYVHTRTGANAPYNSFSVSNVSTSWNDGGASCDIEVFGVATKDEFPDETQIIIWSEQLFDGVEYYFSQNYNNVIVGYIQIESVKRDYDTGSVRCKIGSITNLLKTRKMTSVSIEESAETGTWYRFPANTLTVARAVHHLWNWHSTLFDIANVFLPTSVTTTLSACDDFENGTLYDMVQRFTMDNGIFANVCCNLKGDVYVEQDINVLQDGARGAIDTVMVISGQDRVVETDIDILPRTDNVSLVYISGVGKDAGGDYVPIISACPGEIPDTFGETDAYFERQVLANQTDANQLSGRIFAKLNSEIQELRVELAGNYPIDVVPQEWWEVSDSTNKRFDLISQKFVARSISFSLDIISGTRKPMVVFEPEAVSVVGDGITVIPPEVNGPLDPPAPNWPPIDFPQFPPFGNYPPIPVPTEPPTCSDESPNGPINLYGYTNLISTGYRTTNIFYSAKLRAGSSDNPTSVSIDGDFLRASGMAWIDNPDNDWYHVYAVNIAGTIVAEATMTGSGDIRTGVFSPPAEVSFSFIRIELDPTVFTDGDLYTYNAQGVTDYAGDGGGISPGINYTGSGFFNSYFGNDDCVGAGRPVIYPYGVEPGCGPYCFHSPKNALVEGVGAYPITVGFTITVNTLTDPLEYYMHVTYTGGFTFFQFGGTVSPGVTGTFEFTYNGDISFNDKFISGAGIHFGSFIDPGQNLQITDGYFKLYPVGGECDGDDTAMNIHSVYLYNVCK